MSAPILAIDQGTTSTRAMIFDGTQRIIGVGQQEFTQHYPRSGWVEHDLEDIWSTTLATIRQALNEARLEAGDIAAIGITNQRETVAVWDRATFKPAHRAIVWQDRRTADYCAKLKADGLEPMVSEKTGLLLDPYFSGTKLAWLLDNVDGLRARAEKGEAVFGTIDTYLIARLTGAFVTDISNASRTLMFDIRKQDWDDELLEMLKIPRAMLAEVKDNAADFGTTDPAIFGAAIPVCGAAGDQQAAVIGNACFKPGMVKSTYGTGCFALLNTGTTPVTSKNRLLTTIAYRLGGETHYALEGAIFIAGAAVQWLRDGLGIIENAAQSGELAQNADPHQHVVLVPAFVGLGAPHWDANARGAIFGITRATGPAEFAKAALESVALQTHDLLDAMHKDWSDEAGETVLRVDGGMAASDWAMQRLADVLAAPVDRPVIGETTALGAAWLAGHHVGVWPGQEAFAESWARDRRFEPKMNADERDGLIEAWNDAVSRTLSTR
ncbi:glycerol kinase GlpK [Acuticoccus sp. MNP-M23]|uniref:glycerol kinase GlpK n=1 Tax=Acuticoccus sp. MNP-M23 TaxID=3072793 RepID=UPI002814C8D9|nr:glycerol kinase GlpK [Acuticoccus sp. MNP-M23]WMS43221.1 glycerol kinase GlpK [Acuticoccus sp. MNP-M23]